jgi:hypothetical protein
LFGWLRSDSIFEVEVLDADICVAVDETVVVNVEMVGFGDVRTTPPSATEALHTTPPHVKNLAGPGCPALAIDILCKSGSIWPVIFVSVNRFEKFMTATLGFPRSVELDPIKLWRINHFSSCNIKKFQLTSNLFH